MNTEPQNDPPQQATAEPASRPPGTRWTIWIGVGVFGIGACLLALWLSSKPGPQGNDEPGITYLPSGADAGRVPLPDNLEELEDAQQRKLKEAAQVVRERPDDAAAHGRLGMVLQANGFPDLALRAYANAFRVEPSAPRWHHHWAMLAVRNGDIEGAEQAFRAVIALEPEYAPALEQLGWLLFDQNRDEEAVALFNRVIELAPSQPHGYVDLARVRLSAREAEDAVGLLEHALSLDADHQEAHYLLGRAYQLLGRPEEAKVEFARGGKAEPTTVPDPWIREIPSYRAARTGRQHLANQLVAQGRAVEAVAVFEDLLRDEPDDVSVMRDMARALIILRRLEKAEQLLNRALEIDPESEITHHLLAAMYRAKGAYAAALQEIDEAIRMAPNSGSAYALRGSILSKMGRLEAALAAYRESIRLDARNPRIHAVICSTLGKLQRWTEAQQACEKAATVNPDAPQVLLALSTVYLRTGQADKAIDALERAQRLDPNDPRIPRVLESVRGHRP